MSDVRFLGLNLIFVDTSPGEVGCRLLSEDNLAKSEMQIKWRLETVKFAISEFEIVGNCGEIFEISMQEISEISLFSGFIGIMS